jgi:hypothetical protein
MPFIDEHSGTITLAKGCILSAHMPAKDVLTALRMRNGTSEDLGEGGMIPFPACPVKGGVIAAIAFLENGLLSAVNLSVVAIGQRGSASAEQERAFLFSLLRLRDPRPDTQRTCQLAYTFGSVMVSTDPRTGRALARVLYP